MTEEGNFLIKNFYHFLCNYIIYILYKDETIANNGYYHFFIIELKNMSDKLFNECVIEIKKLINKPDRLEKRNFEDQYKLLEE